MRLLSKGDLFVCTKTSNFNKLMQAPAEVRWSDFLVMRRAPDSADLKLNLGTTQDLAQSMPAIRTAFPLIKQAYAVMPTDGASEVLGLVFADQAAVDLRRTLEQAFRHRSIVPSPAELSVQLLEHLQPAMRFADGGIAGGPVGLSRAHYEQLLDHAAGHGFANDAPSFARYLHCLAVSFAFLSSDGALGDSSESVESLRMYGLALHRESMHLSRLAPEAFKGHEKEIAEVDRMFTDEAQCGHMLAAGQAAMVKSLDPRLAGTMMPARLIGDNLVGAVGGGADELIAEQERNAELVRDMRAAGIEEEPRVRAPMLFSQGKVADDDDAPAMVGPDLSQPDVLEAELMHLMDELGSLPDRMNASDPIARLNAVATVHATLNPLKAALEGAPSDLDAALKQALSAIEQKRQSIQAEKPPEGSRPIVVAQFPRDRQFRIDALEDDIQAAHSKVARQRARVETAIELLQKSAAQLAEGPSQAARA
jgi:hypothetical protein